MNENTSELNQSEYEPLPPDDKELDRLLEEMAETTPDMPADFHDNWMKAVREEAGKQKSPVSQWPKILSVAAAFVLLIGGVILVRSNGQKQQTAITAEPVGAVEAMEAMEAAEAPDTGAAVENKAAGILTNAESAKDVKTAGDAMATPPPAAKARQEEKPAILGSQMSTSEPAEEKSVPLMAAGAVYEPEPAAYDAYEAEEAYEAYEENAAADNAWAAEAAYETDAASEEPDIEAWFAETAKKIGGGILELLSAASH